MTNKRVNVTEVYSVKYLKYEAPVVECDKEYTVSLDRDSVQYFITFAVFGHLAFAVAVK